MVEAASQDVALGDIAPDFKLPDTNGTTVSRGDYAGRKGLLVAFICNHCPFVVHIREAFASYANDYVSQGLGIVAINANDADRYPADSPEQMVLEVARAGYTFPYLYDESQAVARAYGAVCTPEFFLYDANFGLVYAGQFDGSRPNNGVAVTGDTLRAASDALLTGAPPLSEQPASVGCSIKWRP